MEKKRTEEVGEKEKSKQQPCKNQHRHLRSPSSQGTSTEPEGAAQSPVLKECLYFGS